MNNLSNNIAIKNDNEFSCQLALFHALGISDKQYHYLSELLKLNQISLADIFKTPKLFDELIQQQSYDSFQNELQLKKNSIELIKATIQQPAWDKVEQDINWSERDKNYLLSCHDPLYPVLLKEQADHPIMLYVMGDVKLLQDIQIAVVGSRTATPSGLENAHQFAHFLAKNGMVITSGMALGIDASSHQGAIDANGKTIAVAGTGIDRVYPARHKQLAHKIVEQGAIISEFPLGTPPHRKNFPKRNQIISALSVGTLVVEAALKSGSLITARLAMEQAREVFAIPGSIHNPLAKGCHYLIKQGAKLVESAEDIIDEINPLSLASSLMTQENLQQQTEVQLKLANISNLPKDQQFILQFLDDQPVTIDQLQQRSQLPIDDVNALTVLLEIKGYIQTMPGGKVSLV